MKQKVIVGLIGLVVVAAGVYVYMSQKKIGYVNTYEVYDQFKLKKELEDKLKKTALSRQALLDSIKVKVQFTAGNRLLTDAEKALKVAELKENYYLKEKQFSEENESQSQQYTNQIWEQINQYVKEFGDEKGYTYILGANGQGNLMYANEANNISKEVIEYVNKKYDGKVK